VTYETSIVEQWINNDEGLYNYWSAQAREVIDEYPEDEVCGVLAEMLQEEVCGEAPECAGIYSDLLRSALEDVDWVEIALGIISDVQNGR